MSPVILDFVWTGALFSAALALLAWGVQRGSQRPGLAHALWVLVLVKLLVPTWIGIPGVASPFAEAPEVQAFMDLDALAAPPIPLPMNLDLARLPLSTHALDEPAPATAAFDGGTLLLAAWAIGSLLILGVSAARILRFDRRLRRSTELAPLAISNQATRLGQQLGIRRMPRILLTDARLTPMVWGLGLRPTIVLPRALAEDPQRREELHWALAHELGHVRRGDHLVRWLEWLVAVAFWWNPVAWWARRNLRINEEICCDRLVVAKLQAHPKTYANSLLNVVEFLARPELRPPAVASGINSGGAFEKRLTMILTSSKISKTPRWMRVLSLAAAVALLPLGFAEAQEPERPAATDQEPERRLTVEQYQRVEARLSELVAAGRISEEQAAAKLEEVRRYVVRFTPLPEDQIRKELEQQRLNERKKQLVELAEKLDQSVEGGLLTAAEAKEILAKAKMRLEGSSAEAEQKAWDPRTDLKRNVEQWQALVKAGRMSEVEYHEKVLEMELQLRRLEQVAEMEEYRARLLAERMAMEQDLKAAIEQGVLTVDQAERRVAEIQAQMNQAMADLAAAQKVQEEMRWDGEYAEMDDFVVEDPRVALKKEAEAMQKAYAEGRVSREELLERQQAIRRAYEEMQAAESMERALREADRQALKKQYDAARKKVEMEVKAGRLSKEEAQGKLIEMERMAFGPSPKELLPPVSADGKRLDVSRERAEGIVSTMQAEVQRMRDLVEAGKISDAQAELNILKLQRIMAEMEVELADAEARRAQEAENAKEMARKSKAQFAISDAGTVVFNGRDIGGASGVERVVQRLIERDAGNAHVVIQADPKAQQAIINQVIEAAKKAGAKSVHMTSRDR